MMKLNLILDSIDKIYSLNSTVSRYDTNVDLASGRSVVDAKSLLGILSLDCSRPLTANIYGIQEQKLVNALREFQTE